MKDSLPPPEVFIPADAWVNPVAVPHKITHEDLERMTAAFLAGGRVVETIEIGRTSVDSQFNNRLVKTGDINPYLSDDKRERQKRMFAGDSDLVAHIAVALPAQPDRTTLLAELQCSDDKLQRLLRMYFRDDPQADYLRYGCPRTFRKYNDLAKQIRKYPNLCAAEIAREIGVDVEVLRRVIKACGLIVKKNRKRTKEASDA